jgi:pyruvate/2-oxoglutarate dehydrogenase complex dihydrolipoamide acyltransferase (E2) component
MRTQVLMPQWGMGMHEGAVARWLKKVGDAVVKGEALVDVDADKVTATVDAPIDGVLVSIAAQEGTIVEVQGVLAEIESP